MIGLDIGSYSIKAVELKKADNALTLANYKIQKRSHEGALADELKRFFAAGEFISKEIAISVSGHAAVVRVVELPEMTEEELKNAVHFEIERYIPYKMEDAILDYNVIAKNPDSKKITILFAAAKKELVRKDIEEVTQAGFLVKAVDIDGIAVTNAFLNNPIAKDEAQKDRAVALFNIGHAFLNMSILYKGTPFVLRDISGAGLELTENIAKGLGVNKEDAEKIKLEPPADTQDAICEITRPSLVKLVKEIRLSVGYFENQQGRVIDGVYISGGSSKFFGLREFLSEALEVRVESWDPLNSIKINEENVGVSLNEEKYELAVALGLALRDD